MATKAPIHVTITGPAGSGKTTLARSLFKLLQEADVQATLPEESGPHDGFSIERLYLLRTSHVVIKTSNIDRVDRDVEADGQLMRMFEGTIRVLGQQNTRLHEQVLELTRENATMKAVAGMGPDDCNNVAVDVVRRCPSCGRYGSGHEVDCRHVQRLAREKLQAECDHREDYGSTRTTGDPPGLLCCGRCGLPRTCA